MRIESVKRGDLFKSVCDKNSLVCTVDSIGGTALYSIINLESANRWTEPLLYDDFIDYMNSRGFKYIPDAKISVEENNKHKDNSISVKCNMEINEEQIQEIVSEVQNKIIKCLQSNIKLSVW